LNSKILIGIIAVTIFGTLGIQGTMVQAGMFPIETIEVLGSFEQIGPQSQGTSSIQCPDSHPFLIGGDYRFAIPSGGTAFDIVPEFDTATNTYSVELFTGSIGPSFLQVHALCANFNFPMQMGMVGGQLLDINTLPLLVGAIGVNPIITGLVGITVAGIIGQAVWFVHRRKKNLQKKI